MLLILKRTVSMRGFFWAPKTYAKNYKVENIYDFTQKYLVYLNLCGPNKNTLHMFLNVYPFFENSVDPDQLASDEASWSGSTLFHSHDESMQLLIEITH